MGKKKLWHKMGSSDWLSFHEIPQSSQSIAGTRPLWRIPAGHANPDVYVYVSHPIPPPSSRFFGAIVSAHQAPATMSPRRRTSLDSERESSYFLTLKTVSHHDRPSDAWVVHNEQVYDITTFLSQHPGGEDILRDKIGGDITATMDSAHKHSAFAQKLLDKYRIGSLSNAADPNIDNKGNPLIKWDKPILHQVGLLGDKYHDWIHSFPTTDDTVKMFTNDFVEHLTKCPWYVPLLFWIPIILFECVRYIRLIGGLENLNVPLVFCVGVLGGLSWLLFEYALHRFIFHKRTTSYTGNIIHFLIHGHHHITPMDFDRLVFPPVPALMLAAPFWYGSPRVLGVTLGYPWLIGFAIGYLVYDMTHFWIHHAVPRWNFLRMQKRRHVHHHYFKHQVNFGISNPIWDYVFGTIDEPVR